MKSLAPIPTQNEEWGFYGTSKNNGYDAELAPRTTAAGRSSSMISFM
jgi:hypothetical protein